MRRKHVAALLSFLVVSLLSSPPGFTQSADDLKSLRKELDDIKKGQADIQSELQEIKTLLRGRTPAPPAEPQNVVLEVKGDPFKGQPNARLTLVEFSDYQCPFCSRNFRETMPQLEREYIATGKVRYVFRNFPIESIHPLAFKAAEAAVCAGDQGRYWEMHDRLFTEQNALGLKDLPNHAKALALDMPKFQECLDSGKHAARIRKDMGDGQKAGVQGTPSFFVAFTEPNDGMVKVVRIIRGAQPYAVFKSAIDSILADQK